MWIGDVTVLTQLVERVRTSGWIKVTCKCSTISLTRCHALSSHLKVDLTPSKVVDALLPQSRPMPSYQGEGMVTGFRCDTEAFMISTTCSVYTGSCEVQGSLAVVQLVVRALAVQVRSPGFSDPQSYHWTCTIVWMNHCSVVLVWLQLIDSHDLHVYCENSDQHQYP